MSSIEPIEAEGVEGIEVIYESGVLRPLPPLDLAEGTRLEVTVMAVMTVIEIAPLPPPLTPSIEQEQVGGGVPSEGEGVGRVDEETYAAFLSELDNIAALPLQSAPQPHTARNHDAILYPKQGTMP